VGEYEMIAQPIWGPTCLHGFCRRLAGGRAADGPAGAAAEVFADETDGDGALADRRGKAAARIGRLAKSRCSLLMVSLPPGRYSDRRFVRLQNRHIWRKVHYFSVG
jgi:hypothetical protein